MITKWPEDHVACIYYCSHCMFQIGQSSGGYLAIWLDCQAGSFELLRSTISVALVLFLLASGRSTGLGVVEELAVPVRLAYQVVMP